VLGRIFRQDWEAVAGITAAVMAIVLEAFHLTSESTLLTISITLMALLLLRNLRHDARLDTLTAGAQEASKLLGDLRERFQPADVVLIGPSELRRASQRFSINGRGEVVCFNLCLRMYRTQALFDVMLRPFFENPAVTSVRFVLRPQERERWQADVMPKIQACAGCSKLEEPSWKPLEERVSFVMAEVGEGGSEALVSFWGEPFMAMNAERQVPRYVLWVKSGSELIRSLQELQHLNRVD
jgi:hypothetical protein